MLSRTCQRAVPALCAGRLASRAGHATRLLQTRAIRPRASILRPAPFSTTAADATATSTPSRPEKPDYLNDAETVIWDRLTAEFTPVELVVQDISGGCGSMYGIEISSDKFRGLGMLKQQRMVNKALADLMKDWHGVQLRTKIP